MRALVIEDDAAVAAIVARTLEGQGFSVIRAADGAAAVRQGYDETFDLYVLDLNLPELPGLEVLERLRARGVSAPVIVLTGEATLDSAVQSMRRGATDFVCKPLRVAELLRSVERAVARARIENENACLRDELASSAAGEPLIGDAPVMRELIGQARQAAQTSATILITGATGTGKSMLARQIHSWSPRSASPFVAVSCAALPADLVESELFGHERGAFTGATTRRQGRFELAADGTIFLDEIGELPLQLQAKLLRVLQSGEFESIGGDRTLASNARVIAATNRDLGKAVADGDVREDLYFRINVVAIRMPALAERAADIPALASAFARQYARIHGRIVESIDRDALEELTKRQWPGNIRQLRNAVERAVVFSHEGRLRRNDFRHDEPEASLAPTAAAAPGAGVSIRLPLDQTLAHSERLIIESVLERCGYRREEAAQVLGLSLSTLYRRLREFRATSPPATHARALSPVSPGARAV